MQCSGFQIVCSIANQDLCVSQGKPIKIKSLVQSGTSNKFIASDFNTGEIIEIDLNNPPKFRAVYTEYKSFIHCCAARRESESTFVALIRQEMRSQLPLYCLFEFLIEADGNLRET